MAGHGRPLTGIHVVWRHTGDPLMLAAMIGGVVIGERFALEALAGSGGTGSVYRARDRITGEDVAVKILHGHGATPQRLARFTREAMLLSQLTSPSIVRFIDFGTTTDGAPYLVME